MKPIKYLLCSAIFASILTTTGCSVFSVYEIDLPQGTPIAQTEARKIQPGMSKNQVLYIVGSPAFRDTLAPNRWDYIYDYQPGTYGKRDKKPEISDASQHMIVYFNDSGVVSRVEGIETLPVSRQANIPPVEKEKPWFWPF